MQEQEEKKYSEKRNLFGSVSDRTVNEEGGDFPFSVQRRLRGYTTAMIVFIVFGLVSLIYTRSFVSVLFGLLLAGIIWLLGFFERRKFARNGFEVWRMEVLELTKLTPLNRRPTGFYAEALDGPYAGSICHLALTSSGAIPPVGRVILVTVPGNTEANFLKDAYYIPTYYGIELETDTE